MSKAIDKAKLVTLENDLFKCQITPEIGGAIYAFDCKIGEGKMQPMLRHTADDAAADVLNLSSWPLVPFSNRIKYGAFEFEGKAYKVETNYLGGPDSMHASHGQGWQFPWVVEKASDTTCTLSFTFNLKAEEMKNLWPFPYKAIQHFELYERGLKIRFSVTNTGKSNMPAGLGMHPYFHKTPGTTLQAVVKKLWEIDEEVIPTKAVPVPSDYDFREAKSLDTAQLDSCFAGYGGAMQVIWPGAPVALNLKSSDNLNHFVVYTPQGENFFCAEPISHKPNAINDEDWADNGLIILPAGETMEAWYEYEALRRPEGPVHLARLREHTPLKL